MTGLVRKATLLSGALLLVASAAMAGVPSAATSTLPAGLQFVGTQGGVVDVKGEAVVIVRDAGSNRIKFLRVSPRNLMALEEGMGRKRRKSTPQGITFTRDGGVPFRKTIFFFSQGLGATMQSAYSPISLSTLSRFEGSISLPPASAVFFSTPKVWNM